MPGEFWGMLEKAFGNVALVTDGGTVIFALENGGETTILAFDTDGVTTIFALEIDEAMTQ